MKPDKFDLKIQEAAAQNEPAYDDQAWDAMEKLLDEEMPQSKKDKRKIFWLFFLLFVGTAGILMMMRYAGTQEDSIISIKENKTNTSNKAADSLIMKQKMATPKSIDENVVAMQDVSKPGITKSYSEIKIRSPYRRKTVTDVIANDEIINNSGMSSMTDSRTNFQQKTPAPEENSNILIQDDSKAAIGIDGQDSRGINQNITADANTKNDSVINKKNQDSLPEKKAAQQPKNKFGKSFMINFSIGPDVSAVNIKNIGKVEPVYGIGMGYEINKRLTVRTGFYVERKVYDAEPSEYHPPVRFWNYYPDLKYIDADCKIYEVPLIINFNFSQSLKHQWFGSVGISSFFMKKEDYDYLSKTPSGQISYNSYNISNQNQHYFSSLKLSAGYEKKLGNSTSIIAEPYFNYPLSGVGYGKVKLYSAGILFSLNVKPFSKK